MGAFADTAEVPLLLTVEPEPLDFTVTESVQMHAYQGDSNLTISPVTVTNTGSEDLKVSQIEITTETGWSLAAADADFTTADSKNKLAFTLGSHDFSTGAYAIGETLSAGGSNSYQLTGKLSEKADLTASSKVSSFVVTVEKAVSLISFTIEGTSYQAESGMTWAQWCESSYNTDGFYIDSNGCLSKRDETWPMDEMCGYFVTLGTTVLTSTDTVTADITCATRRKNSSGGSAN